MPLDRASRSLANAPRRSLPAGASLLETGRDKAAPPAGVLLYEAVDVAGRRTDTVVATVLATRLRIATDVAGREGMELVERTDGFALRDTEVALPKSIARGF